jgi:tRNA-Thr(GGU) m(6)t(6)A37 methyltransferase TsaA
MSETDVNRQLVFIGQISTPYERVEDCPGNIDLAGPECTLVLEPSYAKGLHGLHVGDQILILYWLEEADRSRLRQHARKSGALKGTFALRSPHRPNPIGAAVVRIHRIEGNSLVVNGLDCVNRTPLLDIKPVMKADKQGSTSGMPWLSMHWHGRDLQ